ncbi:MAG TPA: site-2 protease family protein [Gaiellaceae bacterium]|nr:site-2 protease family protein [Gaiellaceae bacterium]
MNLFLAILGLGLLVLIHEAGHFFTARAVGMSPRRFYIGFPPAVVRVKRKGIEYGIGAIPLGGYVKIPGMHRPAPSDLETFFGPALAEAPQLLAPLERLKRKFEEGDMEGARQLLPDLERALGETEVGNGARKAANRGLNELRDGLGSDAYWRQRTWKKVLVIFAGPGTNLLFAILLFFMLFLLVGGKATRTVDAVETGMPADSIGLRPGDQIVSVNGVRVTPTMISREITSSNGRPVTLIVRRDGELVRLRAISPEVRDGAYRLGFRLSARSLGPAASLWESVRLTGVITKEIGASLGRLVQGNRKEVSSPVGIVEGSSNAIERGYETYLWVLALLSLSLALLNLLPLLPLDGGHIVFSIVEGVRGRAVGREVYERVSAVGIALVLLLFFIGLSNDIGRHVGN